MNSNSINGMGRLNCVAFHPVDDGVLWVGAPSGGLWKTEDGGLTWSCLTDGLPNIGVSDVVVRLDDPDTLYMALGDGDAGHTVSLGVLRSSDGGRSWQKTGLDLSLEGSWRVHKLALDVDRPALLMAATSGGLYRSINEGAEWHKVLDGLVKDIEHVPTQPARWLAAVWGDGVYRSTDDGASWTRASSGLPSRGIGRINLAVAPSEPQRVYASFAGDGPTLWSGFAFEGLYRSDDGGDSWALQSTKPNVFGSSTFETGGTSYSLGHYANVLTISPEDPDVVYIGSVNLWRSSNGGRSWDYLTNQRGQRGAEAVHVDHHDLVFRLGDGVLFDCNDGGLVRSDDRGETWMDLSEGLVIRQVYRIGLSAHHPEHFVIGCHDNGSDYRSDRWRSMFTGDGMSCFIDPDDPLRVYFSYQNARLFRSANGGLSALEIGRQFAGRGAWVTPFLIDPIDSATLYTAIRRVYRSSNRGTSWQAVSPELSGADIAVLAVAPSDPQRMLASDGRRLFLTADGGSTWSEIEASSFSNLITDIGFHPADSGLVWLTLGGYGEWQSYWHYDYSLRPEKVFNSEDGGVNWIDVTDGLLDLPVNCVAVDRTTSSVYLGTDLGVYMSSDGRGGWREFNHSLPNVVVTDLEIDDQERVVWASTFGRGVWRSPLAPYEEISDSVTQTTRELGSSR